MIITQGFKYWKSWSTDFCVSQHKSTCMFVHLKIPFVLASS